MISVKHHTSEEVVKLYAYDLADEYNVPSQELDDIIQDVLIELLESNLTDKCEIRRRVIRRLKAVAKLRAIECPLGLAKQMYDETDLEEACTTQLKLRTCYRHMLKLKPHISVRLFLYYHKEMMLQEVGALLGVTYQAILLSIRNACRNIEVGIRKDKLRRKILLYGIREKSTIERFHDAVILHRRRITEKRKGEESSSVLEMNHIKGC